jgi:hypothetical protein
MESQAAPHSPPPSNLLAAALSPLLVLSSFAALSPHEEEPRSTARIDGESRLRAPPPWRALVVTSSMSWTQGRQGQCFQGVRMTTWSLSQTSRGPTSTPQRVEGGQI